MPPLLVENTVATPCIGLCSTVYGDNICRGCKRYAEEVIAWNQYANGEKLQVINRLERLLTPIIASKLTISQPTPLQSYLDHHQLRYHAWQNPYCWFFDLLRQRHHQLTQLELKTMGVIIHETYQTLLPSQLFGLIDEEFMQLSIKWYSKPKHSNA